MMRSMLAPLALLAPLAAHAATQKPVPPAPTQEAVCASLPAVQTLLPCGMFHTAGSQIVDQSNRPVRLNCTAWWGDSPNPMQSMLTAITAGFNCFRVSYFNASIDNDLAMIDKAVAAAGPLGLRIIINSHANEGNGDCVSQQANGLWYDKGPGTDGTDGCGSQGTVTNERFEADWVRVAKRYAGNPTVIGFDIVNEPLEAPNGNGPMGGSVWGGGGVTDILAMYERVGNALQAVSPDALIICEGPILWAPLFGFDLTHVASQPVVLKKSNQVVYSVHIYPSEIGGQPHDTGPQAIQEWNTGFGYLITQDIAPVWVGEIGASMKTADAKDWAATIVPYLNGKAPGGIVIKPGGQGVSTDWWMWSSLPGGLPDGALESDMLTPKENQASIYSQFVQGKLSGPVASSAASQATSAAYGQVVAAASAEAFPAPAPTTTPQATGPDAAYQDASSEADQQASAAAAQVDAVDGMVADMQAKIDAMRSGGIPSVQPIGALSPAGKNSNAQ